MAAPPPPGDRPGEPGAGSYDPYGRQGESQPPPPPEDSTQPPPPAAPGPGDSPGQPGHPPPGQPGHPPPGQPYGGPPQGGSNGMAVAALVCGIIALLSGLAGFLLLTIPLAIVLGLVGVVLGIVGTQRARDSGIGRGQAIGGIVTGALGLVAGILWVAGLAALIPAFEEMLDDPQIQEELRELEEQPDAP